MIPQQNTLTEPLTQQIGTSTVTLTEKEFTISIPRTSWTKKQWNGLLNPSFGVEPTQFFLSKSEFDNISAC
jgi:hypothetical protein